MRTNWQKDEPMFWAFFVVGMLSDSYFLTVVSLVAATGIAAFHLSNLRWEKKGSGK